MIRISSSRENKYIIYSETQFNFSVFERDAKTGEFEALQPLIPYSNIKFANHYFEKLMKDAQYSDKETVFLLYRKSGTASGRRLQEEEESAGEDELSNAIRIYYGTEPVCDLCGKRVSGLLIAGIVMGVICLLVLVIGLTCGIRKLCRKVEKKPKKAKKVDYEEAQENPVKFETGSYQENETISDAFKTNEEDYFQPKPNPNIALKKDTIPANREQLEITESM